VAQAARTAGEGLWPQDKTNTGMNVPALTAISEQSIILPKLFPVSPSIWNWAAALMKQGSARSCNPSKTPIRCWLFPPGISPSWTTSS
jgi:hypothetical protein